MYYDKLGVINGNLHDAMYFLLILLTSAFSKLFIVAESLEHPQKISVCLEVPLPSGFKCVLPRPMTSSYI